MKGIASPKCAAAEMAAARKPGLFLLVLAIMAGCAGAAESLPPLPSNVGYDRIPAFSYADETEARAAWRPRDDSQPVSRMRAGEREALRLPCAFQDMKADRASWDWRVNLNLAERQGLRFRFFCANPGPVSYFTVHLRSGEGWYQTTFAPSGSDAWTTVRLDKVSSRVEGKPSGWSAIDLVRISAWRRSNEDTECAVADFGLEGKPPLGLLWSESLREAEPKDFTNARDYTLYMGTLLDDLGLPYAVVSDLDAATMDWAQFRLLIMPYCPNVDAAGVAKLREFVAAGGKLVSFYKLPSELAPDLGFRLGEHVAQKQPGDFASMRPTDEPIPGFPAALPQSSWNIIDAAPVEGRSRVAARWYDAEGRDTGHNAVLVSDAGVHVTHVLLEGKRPERRAFMAALLCNLAPKHWPTVVRTAFDRAERVGPYATAAEFKAALPVDSPAVQPFNEAESALATAQALAGEDKHAEALRLAEQGHDLLLRAYCAAQKPAPNEHRAFWCHNAYGVPGLTWDEAVKLLADNGFTAIHPNMLWGGVAYYQSEVLPVAPEVEAKGDQITACLDACKKHGIQCHVWKVNFMLGSGTTKDFVERMNREGRLQVTFNGATTREWLCPSHPDNRELEAAALVEVARNYDVDGIHLDYIRYPDQDACFCGTCRTQFEAVLGRALPDWPRGVRENPAVLEQWREFRRGRITGLVADISRRVREARPGIKISAAVFPDWQRERDVLGQDWKDWCDKGYVDFVCPMDYTSNEAEFRIQVKLQTAWAGKVPCYPGIGLSTWPRPDDVENLIAMITATRALGTGGFTVFNYGPDEAQSIVPLCGLGITRK